MLRTGQFDGRQRRRIGDARPALLRPLLLVAAVASCLVATSHNALAQLAPVPLPPVAPTTVAPQPLPEPIYWKQHLFLIPYQWGSAAQSGAAQSVTLFVSKDRGANWQKISEARPQVKSFNYRAEGDGEYWFAVRTLDVQGRLWPQGPYQPELRVVVDTTIPRIDTLRVQPIGNGAIDIECRATDVNLDPASLKVEAQLIASGPWQMVALQPLGSGQPGVIQVRCQPAPGVQPVAIRAKIADRAGNSADYQSTLGATPTAAGPMLSQPALSTAGTNPFDAMPKPTAVPVALPPVGAAASAAPAAAPAPPATQTWPVNQMTSAPFRLWTTGTSQQDDNLTAYGSPRISTVPTVPFPPSSPPRPLSSLPLPPGEGRGEGALNALASNTPASQQRIPAHYAGATKSDDVSNSSAASPGWTSSSNPTGPQFAPLEPYRQTPATAAAGPGAAASAAPAIARPNNQSITPIDTPPPANRPTVQPKLVGSRTFALEYDLDGVGSGGVAKVELWGTRDGGQSWYRFAQDDDNRSPLVVTVDDEGTYGFKILVQNAGAAANQAPRPGEAPELWVSVDLKRPIVELTTIERGEGNLADHLILHWRAQDNNLEQRPISLYFSSRPSGPWSAVATNLADTGQYAWRVERYVPTKIYLRIEARDTAGNLAAFQTREPVEFSSPQPAAHLRAAPTTAANR